ncbi:hypothetical protein ACFLQR_04035, partial [Verrucomicrobiota bacterium]
MMLNFLPHLVVVLFIGYFLYDIVRKGGVFSALTSLVPGVLHWPFLMVIIERFSGRPFYDDLRYLAIFGGMLVTLFVVSNVRNAFRANDQGGVSPVLTALRNAYCFRWWQILFFPAYISFLLMYLGRYEMNFAGTANGHHFFHPMLMVEYGDFRYIHFWSTALTKPGTSKYITAFFGWLYLKFGSLT